MHVIVCLDDNQGMLFNSRRQSRDEKVLEDIAKLTDVLWVGSFSEKLFEEFPGEVKVDDAFLDKASEAEFCFAENQRIMPYIDKVEQMIVYRWNRKYPADFNLDVPLNEWKILSETEFSGKSHEKITKQIFIRG